MHLTKTGVLILEENETKTAWALFCGQTAFPSSPASALWPAWPEVGQKEGGTMRLGGETLAGAGRPQGLGAEVQTHRPGPALRPWRQSGQELVGG